MRYESVHKLNSNNKILQSAAQDAVTVNTDYR